MIDINCDMGEGMANDEAIMPYISSVNIACGYHAGDTDTIKRTIDLCLQHQVAIGVHPSFYDRENFGRTEMHIGDAALYDLICEQLDLFSAIAHESHAVLHHVKPHGALYNMATRNYTMSKIIANAVYSFDKQLILYGLAGSHLITAGNDVGLRTASEVFADRTYQNDGSLTPRTHANAIISSESQAVAQILQMIHQQRVTATDGTVIPVHAETVCIHGDNPAAVTFAKAIHDAFKKSNIDIRSC
jgi:UPF0271 protein